MEFDKHVEEEEEEEEIETQLTPENYEPENYSDRVREAMMNGRAGGYGYRYRECLKNHAVGIGGQAVDGCGEFMAAGEEGTLAALQCAACNCHRNFHRKESAVQITPPPSYNHHHRPSGYLHHQRPLALPSSTSRDDLEEISNPSSGSGGGGSRKRFRTKFTQDQKDRMLPFAEAIGWRIGKEHEAAVERFCEETGVNRQVLKVWMHNNKHTLGKKP